MDESININPFMASGANGTMIDDFSGDNFDHSQLGFIGGQYVGAIMTNGRPIEFHPTPPGTPTLGARMEEGSRAPLQPHDTHSAARHFGREPAQLSRPGPDLEGRLGSTSAAHDVRFSRKRHPHVAVYCRQGRGDRRAMGRKTIVRGGTKRPYTTRSIKARTTPAALSWATIPGRASSIATSSAGTCLTFSASALGLPSKYYLQLYSDDRRSYFLGARPYQEQILKIPGPLVQA